MVTFRVSPCFASILSGVILPFATVRVMSRVLPPPPALRNATTAPMATNTAITATMTRRRLFPIASPLPREWLGQDAEAGHGVQDHEEQHRVLADQRPLGAAEPLAGPQVGQVHGHH